MTRPRTSRHPSWPSTAHTSTGGATGLAKPITGLVEKTSWGCPSGVGWLRVRRSAAAAASRRSATAVQLGRRFHDVGLVEGLADRHGADAARRRRQAVQRRVLPRLRQAVDAGIAPSGRRVEPAVLAAHVRV